ncbi:hypothetical protein BK011_07750 [Tenericutes bacterium MZ-XQ]|nr:hypothetical protein BK011_07750 [Tenericutes bacterium MZ-XQ]
MAKSKIYFIINMFFYLDIVILSIVISNFGLESTNGFFLVSPYLFIFIFANYFKIFQPDIRKYYALTFLVKVLLVLLGYNAGKYILMSTVQVLLFSVLICLIFVSHMMDNYIFHNKKFKEVFLNSYQIPDMTMNNLANIADDENLRELFSASKTMISKLHFNTFCLGFSYVLLIMSIIFVNSTVMRIFGIVLIFISILLCFYILRIFYMDFIINKKIGLKLGVSVILTAIVPFSLYIFHNFVLSSSNTYIFALLVVFIIPYWSIYKKEAKLLWDKFILEYKEKIGSNDF